MSFFFSVLHLQNLIQYPCRRLFLGQHSQRYFFFPGNYGHYIGVHAEAGELADVAELEIIVAGNGRIRLDALWGCCLAEKLYGLAVLWHWLPCCFSTFASETKCR